MARKTPQFDVLRALLARSGNKCSFPSCNHPIINENNKLIAQLCHIEAAEKGGERYNPDSNDEERRSYNNLLFLCYRHHIETDDTEKFTVTKMREIKENHESKYKENHVEISDTILTEILNDIDLYWRNIEHVHEKENTMPDDLKFELNFNANILELLELHSNELKFVADSLDKLKQSDEELPNKLHQFFIDNGFNTDELCQIEYSKNPFFDRNWEFHNIGNPNIKSRLAISFKHLELKVLELQLKTEINNTELSKIIEDKRFEFKELVKEVGYFD